MPQSYYKTNKTALYFCKASRFLVVGGLPGYIKWQESGFPKPTYKYVYNFLTASIFVFISLELGALVTQQNLSEKQKTDLLILCFSHPILLSYHFVIQYHKEKLKELIFKLCVTLKNAHNDPVVERGMIKKATVYSVLFSMNVASALILYGFDGLLEVIYSDGTFVTVITAWPDVDDRSTWAYIGRVISYFIWWVWMSRVTAVFIIIIITTVCLSHQYTNLQSYFNSLNEIFDLEDECETNLADAEHKYEEAFKLGIKLHAETLWCTRQCQVVCSIVYSAHIIVQVAVLSMLMLQMVVRSIEMLVKNIKRGGNTKLGAHANKRSSNSCDQYFIARQHWRLDVECWRRHDRGKYKAAIGLGSIPYGTAAYNIRRRSPRPCDVEETLVAFNDTSAARVATAMYSSGWQNCRGERSQRIRKLLFVALTQAQRKVVIRSFGIMEMSYQAYVSIVKSSYSAFSLLY